MLIDGSTGDARDCRCGCRSRATHIVAATDPDGPFVEACCGRAAGYLSECSTDAGEVPVVLTVAEWRAGGMDREAALLLLRSQNGGPSC